MHEAQTETIRTIIATVLEVGREEIGGDAHFVHDLGADSLRIIEILARLEKAMTVVIDQAEIARMVTFESVCDVVRQAQAGTVQ